MNRRVFLESIGLSAGVAATGGARVEDLLTSSQPQLNPARDQLAPDQNALVAEGAFASVLTNDPIASAIPPRPVNPNILVILVDQLRLPQFWTSAAQQSMIDTIAPNIAFLRKNSCNFLHHFTSAATCTPARSTLLTGLYTRQTAMYLADNQPINNLDTRFPTFGSAVAAVNPAYAGNVFWEGKWHLSDPGAPGSLAPYGFNVNGGQGCFYPLYPDQYGSPVGTGNQGNNGYPATVKSARGSDSAVAGDFIAKWPAAPPTPWVSVVSLLNPHDISFYPNAFPPQAPSGPPGALQPGTTNFLPSFSGLPNNVVFGSPPNPTIGPDWNYADNVALKNLTLQTTFQEAITDSEGSMSQSTPADGVGMLNYYFYLVSLVDMQIGRILQAVGINSLQGGNPLSDTVVIFSSDHGEFGFSHGLRGKGGAAYDEAIRIPLYVMLPLQSGTVPLEQMCSQVDFFRFIVDLTAGNSNWTTGLYADQANRQSLASFIWGNAPETRVVTVSPPGIAPFTTPYALHTTDEIYIFEEAKVIYGCDIPNHLLCFRTKSTEANPYTGAKLCIYDRWLPNTTTPDMTARQCEYYDYTNLTNRLELGNDYYTANQTSLNLLQGMRGALSGSVIQKELGGALTGQYPNSGPNANLSLHTVTQQATGRYYSAVNALVSQHACPPGSDG